MMRAKPMMLIYCLCALCFINTCLAQTSSKTGLRLRPNLESFHFKRYFHISSNFSKDSDDPRKMVDPRRVASYEEVLKLIHHPKKVLIDVRDPDEVESSGKIPSSINIPLGHVDTVLNSMSDEEFHRKYNREKPKSSDELIFYCRSGRRSAEALDKAIRLGYTNSKTYLGSWNEWSDKQK